MTCLRFNKKQQNIPNRRITNKNLLKIFYMSLNANTKVVADIIIGVAFMSL